jgi:hypothetical protein
MSNVFAWCVFDFDYHRYDYSCNTRQAFFYDAFHGSINTPYPGARDAAYPRLQVRSLWKMSRTHSSIVCASHKLHNLWW